MAKVIVYGMSTCPHCVTAKKFFDENNIEYTYKDVKEDKEARAEFVAKGHTGVPVIVIDDEEILGFNQAQIEAKLAE